MLLFSLKFVFPVPIMDFGTLTLNDVIDQGWDLLTVRDYFGDGSVVLEFGTKSPPQLMLLDVAKLKKNKGIIEEGSIVQEETGKSFHELVSFVRQEGRFTTGYFNQRPSCIKLFLKFYMKFSVDILPVADDPREFAEDCGTLYCLTKQLLHSEYIERFMQERLHGLDTKTNLTGDAISDLKKLHDGVERKNDKNQQLRDFLVEKSTTFPFHGQFHALWTEKFCGKYLDRVKDEVRRVLKSAGAPNVDIAGAKSAYRIQQKYDEYCQSYLSAGLHVYKKFKDLFRGSITYEDYKNVDPTKLPISSTNARESGNYRAFYVILNIFTFNFELKVVQDLSADDESHLWYELKRNGGLGNLKEFIKREISSSDINLPEFSSSSSPSLSSSPKEKEKEGSTTKQ